LHVFFPGKKSPDRSKAKSAKKQQQCGDAEPLYALDGLQKVFVHFLRMMNDE
jgi:hypothetical protein